MRSTATPLDLSVQAAIGRIASARRQIDTRRSTLVGISGINGSGKGYLTRDIDRRLRSRGFTVAVINVDGWLRLPHERFAQELHFQRDAPRQAATQILGNDDFDPTRG